MSNLIAASSLWGFRELVHELGGDPESLLSRFDLPHGVEQEEDAFISLGAYIDLLEACAADLDCPDFGLRLGQWQGLDILGPVAVIARNAHTVREGWEAIARYLYAHSTGLKLTPVAPTAERALTFVYEVNAPAHVIVQGCELGMAIAARIIRLLCGPDAHPSVVAFPHDQQGSDAAYRDALGCPVRFRRTRCGFQLSAQLADRTIDGADPETRRIAAKYLESNYLPPTARLSERVAELTHRLLPTGQCSADAIASELSMHTRTLQRRLAAEGVRCGDLIDRERRRLAVRYLAEPDMQFSQIASLLGYAEQSALNRSCRRWFGKTPRQLRAEAATP